LHHVATIHHRVPEVTQVTSRHPGRQLTLQFLSDDRVQLFTAVSGRDPRHPPHCPQQDDMSVDEPWEDSRGGVLGHLPGFVELNVPGLDTDSPIERNRRSSVAELLPCEHS
jgi:hypothetical protein